MRRRTVLALLGMLWFQLVPVPSPARGAPNEGTVDLAFGSCGVATTYPLDPAGEAHNATATAVAVQPDGRIVLAGDDTVVRLLADGSPDYGFGYNGTAFLSVVNMTVGANAVAIQADGRVVVAGYSRPVIGGPITFWVIRLLSNGTFDPSFGTSGRSEPGLGLPPFAIALQADGRIVVGAGGGVVRLLPNGQLDQAFASGGVFSLVANFLGVVLQPDGRIVAALGVQGERNGDIGVLRLNPDGTRDGTFGNAGQTQVDIGHDNASGITLDASGRVVTVGSASVGGGRMGVVLLRHLANGTLDPTFGDGGVVFSTPASDEVPVDVALDAAGRLVVGAVARPSGTEAIALFRYSTDGRRDPTFGALVGTDIHARALAPTPDGAWVVSGVRSVFSTAVRFHGGADADTVTPTTCSKEATLQPVAFGEFDTWPVGTTSTPHAYRLTSTGTAPIRPGPVAIVREARTQFRIVADECAGRTLAPGGSCTVAVTFAPTVSGRSLAGMAFWSDAGPRMHQTLFDGVGGAPLTLDGWGWNGFGQVGTGGPDAPVDARPIGLPGVVSVASGYYHSLAVKTDGTVWTWGWNAFGQLGDGTVVNRFSPVQVPGLAGIAAVAAGAYHSFAIGRDGSVRAWGLNSVGQLGDGTTIDRHAPVRLLGVPSIAEMAGGAVHTVALASDGQVLAWGWNAFGQLGDGTTVDRSSPVTVPGLSSVHDVAAGAFHSMAVTRPGPVRAWGLNHLGQLGDGTTVDRHSPTVVPGTIGAAEIAAGAFHGLAVSGTGEALAWGWNVVGQLGDGTNVDRLQPVRVALRAGVRDVAAGAYHSVAVMESGSIATWGWNVSNQLNHGDAPAMTRPGEQGGFGGVRMAAAGVYHTLVG
jgi:uncharacterized delta-60 repeat protein